MTNEDNYDIEYDRYDPPRRKSTNTTGESDTDRYWREIKERQIGENTPEYDPWTGSWF